MPLYEYICDTCNDTFQRLELRFEDSPEECICRNCGAIAKRTLAQCSFELVGKGWPGKEIKNG